MPCRLSMDEASLQRARRSPCAGCGAGVWLWTMGTLRSHADTQSAASSIVYTATKTAIQGFHAIPRTGIHDLRPVKNHKVQLKSVPVTNCL